jgi:hypothetical protein
MAPDLPESPPSSRSAQSPANALRDNRADLPSAAEMTRLGRDNPAGFLENCLRRYQREVKGYTLIMQKQEFLDGKLNPREVIEVCFRDQPHSVYLNWIEGSGRAERALYVEGENNGKMLARPNGLIARKIVGDVVERDVDSPDARHSGRYTLNEYGLKKAAERTLAAYKNEIAKNNLKYEYLGVQKVPEVGDRPCHTLRFHYSKPLRDGVTEATFYIDAANWLQVGSVLKRADDSLVGAYYFRDIKLNPEFKPDQFKRAALAP